MSLTDYVTLGRSGLRVSPFCLGAMTFGDDWGWGASVAESEAMMALFIERGGNFIDTANIYTKGHSEKIIGDFIGHDRSRRDRLVIATKFFGNLYPGDPNGGGAGRKSLMNACEQSLRRLRTDYIDLYWLHFQDLFTPVEETMRALDDLVRSGKVRYIGFSDTFAWRVAQAQMLAQMHSWTPLVALQIEYSLIERTVENELIPMAQEMGLGVTPWSPLRGGVLTGKYTRATTGKDTPARGERVTAYLDEKAYAIIDELIRIARVHDTTPAAIALAWLRGRPMVASTIIGVRSVIQLEQNLQGLDIKLASDEAASLSRLSEPPHPFPWVNVRNFGIMLSMSGTAVNGVTSTKWPLAPQSDTERY